jgi:hypothetical protein
VFDRIIFIYVIRPNVLQSAETRNSPNDFKKEIQWPSIFSGQGNPGHP